MTPKTVAVVGASGLIGSHTVHALRRRGHSVMPVRAPRVALKAPEPVQVIVQQESDALDALAEQFRRAGAVINAAGKPDAASTEPAALYAANAMTAAVVARAASKAGVRRFVHVSSAAVQGRLPVLDESLRVDAFSDYARSKALGEILVLEGGPTEVVIYRPGGVHSIDRTVTRAMARLARSPIASVARPGTSPTPQALVENVADAIAFLATTEDKPPKVVVHPWEGLTTFDLMALLGFRSPLKIPYRAARSVVVLLRHFGSIGGPLRANARRVEMLWFGQEQSPSWLSSVGWTPPAGLDEWRLMAEYLRDQAASGRIWGEVPYRVFQRRARQDSQP